MPNMTLTTEASKFVTSRRDKMTVANRLKLCHIASKKEQPPTK